MATITLPVPSVSTQQSEASKIVGLIFAVGIQAVSVFVKNPNHQQTAASIITVLTNLLPDLEGIL